MFPIDLSFRKETATKTGMVMVLGEITTSSVLDYQKIIRNTIKEIGYDDSSKGTDFYLTWTTFYEFSSIFYVVLNGGLSVLHLRSDRLFFKTILLFTFHFPIDDLNNL